MDNEQTAREAVVDNPVQALLNWIQNNLAGGPDKSRLAIVEEKLQDLSRASTALQESVTNVKTTTGQDLARVETALREHMQTTADAVYEKVKGSFVSTDKLAQQIEATLDDCVKACEDLVDEKIEETLREYTHDLIGYITTVLRPEDFKGMDISKITNAVSFGKSIVTITAILRRSSALGIAAEFGEVLASMAIQAMANATLIERRLDINPLQLFYNSDHFEEEYYIDSHQEEVVKLMIAASERTGRVFLPWRDPTNNYTEEQSIVPGPNAERWALEMYGFIDVPEGIQPIPPRPRRGTQPKKTSLFEKHLVPENLTTLDPTPVPLGALPRRLENALDALTRLVDQWQHLVDSLTDGTRSLPLVPDASLADLPSPELAQASVERLRESLGQTMTQTMRDFRQPSAWQTPDCECVERLAMHLVDMNNASTFG